jgi:hypothetical protein
MGSPLLEQIAPAFAPWVVRGLLSTCTVTLLNRAVKERYVDGRLGCVIAIWHADILLHLDRFRRRGIVVMTSRSRDGELAARTLHRAGFGTVRGSSSTGGAEALREITARARAGGVTVIVVDGPRGPAKRAKAGCVLAARNAGVPLIPVACHVTRAIRLRSWDRTVVPLPGAHVVIGLGEPLTVPPDAAPEECESIRAELDRRMGEVEDSCRRAAGSRA